MAWADLETHEQEIVKDFIRTYRAALAETVRGLRSQELLSLHYTGTINALWAQVAAGDVIPDGTGLSGADTTMTKADYAAMFTWTNNLLAGVFKDAGGQVNTVWPAKAAVEGYAVRLAGPTNVS